MQRRCLSSGKLPVLCRALVVVTVLARCVSAVAADYVIRVDLQVTAEEAIRDEVSSFLFREIRSLPNVRVDAGRPDFVLSVVALATKTTDGRETGYAMCILVTEPLDTGMLSLLVTGCAKCDTSSAYFYDGLARGSEYIRDLWLRTGPSDKLRGECTSVIAAFDSKFLEPTRKLREKVVELRKTLGE